MTVPHIDSYYAASAHPAPDRPPLAGRRRSRRLRRRRRHRRLRDCAVPGRARLQGRAARGQPHRLGRIRPQRRPGHRRLRMQPGQAGRAGRQGRRAEDVRHLGRRARPDEGAGRETSHRLRPALGTPAHRDQAAARRRTCARGRKNWRTTTATRPPVGWIARELSQVLNTDRYIGALRDDRSGHLHPLNYTLGLAAAADGGGRDDPRAVDGRRRRPWRDGCACARRTAPR